jgi:hypothetical protein
MKLVGSDNYIDKLTQNVELANTLARNSDIAQQTFKDLGAVAQGAIAGGMDTKNDSDKRQTPSQDLKESEINSLFENIVLEANLWDKFKSGAKGAAGAVAKGVQNVGKSMTHKFTMGSLESAWKKSGSPTDSEDIISLLRTLGVPQPAIDQAMKSIGVETLNRANLPDITKLSREEQTELLAVLDKMETA